ncbi:DUF2029 domain-containing protein [Streptomyces jumonjinensis]|uniref:DUF2029 domain-containing protein n=1 Tax=Streptomyces jumonjinensis TaxID=1945 RepID=A0A646KMB6_STRJU|nr:DUF2029 domain-containing protein [Streptomyces jumonjinensis]
MLAGAFALVTTVSTHRLWGVLAAAGYAVAALAASRHSAARATALAAVTTALLPLAVLCAADSAQLEVRVVEEAARDLLRSGTPYDAAPAEPADYNPYLPAMALFGIPGALLGLDPRWFFALCFLAALAYAGTLPPAPTSPKVTLTPAAPKAPRATAGALTLLIACPPVAMTLAVSGIDLPVIGLMALGLALAAQGRPGAAGLVLGLASAMKWTAWPAAAVACALLFLRYGRGSAGRLAASAAAVLAVCAAPVAVRDPGAFAEHAVAFPLGLADVPSPAASPLPGQLLATALPGGDVVAVTLLAAAAVTMALSLVLRPPATVTAAADRVALGLLAALLLAPATRYGYLLYPLVLSGWFRLVGADLGWFRAAGSDVRAAGSDISAAGSDIRAAGWHGPSSSAGPSPSGAGWTAWRQPRRR